MPNSLAPQWETRRGQCLGVLELRLGEDGEEWPDFQHLEDLDLIISIMLIFQRKIQKEIWELKSKHEIQFDSMELSKCNCIQATSSIKNQG